MWVLLWGNLSFCQHVLTKEKRILGASALEHWHIPNPGTQQLSWAERAKPLQEVVAGIKMSSPLLGSIWKQGFKICVIVNHIFEAAQARCMWPNIKLDTVAQDFRVVLRKLDLGQLGPGSPDSQFARPFMYSLGSWKFGPKCLDPICLAPSQTAVIAETLDCQNRKL